MEQYLVATRNAALKAFRDRTAVEARKANALEAIAENLRPRQVTITTAPMADESREASS